MIIDICFACREIRTSLMYNYMISVVCVCVCVCVLEGRRRSQVVSEPTTPTGSSNSKKENYIIIVDERKIKVSIYCIEFINVIRVYTCTLLYVMREFTCKVSTNYP